MVAVRLCKVGPSASTNSWRTKWQTKNQITAAAKTPNTVDMRSSDRAASLTVTLSAKRGRRPNRSTGCKIASTLTVESGKP